jgi:hypothetical protein
MPEDEKDMQESILGVLLVDDDEDDTFMLQEALTQAPMGKVVWLARDGEEALLYLRRFSSRLPG